MPTCEAICRSPADYSNLLHLIQMAMTLAAGGRCVSDIAVLRDQRAMFGEVASDATVWRVFDAIDNDRLEAARSARAQVTAALLDRFAPCSG